MQNGETLATAGIGLTGSLAFNGSTATSVLNANTYTQTQGTLGLTSNNGNYALSFANPTPNNYLIKAASLTVTPNAVATSYNGVALNNTTYSDTLANYSFGPLQNGETLATAGIGLTGSLAFNGSTATSVLNANTYTQTQGTLGLTSNNGNYALSFANPTPNNYLIKAASLTVTPNAVATSYNGVALNNTTYSDTLANYSFGPLQNGETLATAGIGLTGSLAFNGSTATSVLNANTYTQTQGTLGLTSNNGNYALSFANPTPNNYLIKAASLTVTPNAVATSYNGVALNNTAYSDTLANYSFGPLQNGETLATAGIGLTGSLAFNGSTATSVLNANTYTQTQGGLMLTSNNGNYALSFANPTPNNYLIKAASLTVTPNAVATSYNGVALNNTAYSDTLANYSFGPLQNGETLATAGIGLTGSLAFNGSTATSVLNTGHGYTQAQG